jgi:hypothetical protein
MIALRVTARFTALALCALAGFAAGEARAESLAVLGIEAVDAPEATANALTEALRSRARDTAGVRLVPSKDFMEMKLLYNCMEPGQMSSCLAQAGKSLGADKILFGSITGSRRKRSLRVSIKLVDSANGQVLKSIDEQVGSLNVDTAARLWFAQLVPPSHVEPQAPARGTLLVISSPADATVSVDGREVGRTPTQVTVNGAGSHGVVIAKDGYEPDSRTLVIRPGETEKLDVALRAIIKTPPLVTTPPINPPTNPPTNPPVETAAHPGRTLQIVGAVALVLGVAAIGIEIYTWQAYNSLEKRIYDPSNGTGDLQVLATSNPDWVNANAGWVAHPDCSPPPQVTNHNGQLEPGLSSDTYKNYVNDCNHGQTLASASTALLVTGLIVSIAGAAALGVGTWQSKHSTDSPKQARFAPRLRTIGPSLGRTGGGVQATFEF